MSDAAAVFVGWDWGTETHQVSVVDLSGASIEEWQVRHDGKELSQACDRLLRLTSGDPAGIWVAIETPTGAVVEALMERGVMVFSINPKQLDRFRDRHTVAGAKDDSRDAFVLADSLRTDGHLFRRLEAEDGSVIELREWSRILQDLGQERVRLTNQIRPQLNRYYPQILALGGDLWDSWILDLWEMAPTPAKAKRLRKQKVAALLKKHRIRRLNADEVVATLRQKALHATPGSVEAASAHIRLAIGRLRLVKEQTKQCEQTIDALTQAIDEATSEGAEGESREHRDVAILRSLPGVGRIVLATLLAEAARPLRARDYHTLRSLCGIAPVTKASGKSRSVLMRRACDSRLREACYHWARTATMADPWSRSRYAASRQRGHSHGRALRGLADRLLRVAVSMLRQGELYDPSRRRVATT